MQAGKFDRRVTLKRRATQAGAPGGVSRGDYVDARALWCALRQQQNVQQVPEAGFPLDPLRLILRVRDSAANRTISTADRLDFDGQDFRIDSVGLPDRSTGTIELVAVRALEA